MKRSVALSQIIEGYLMHASARHLSENTIIDYSNTYRKLQQFFKSDPDFASITHLQIEQFLSNQNGISNKTLLNYHTGLSALWTWAVAEGLAPEHILRRVIKPKPEQRDIIPFTEQDIHAIIGAIVKSRPYTRPGKRESVHSLPHPERTHAMLQLLRSTL